MAWRTSWFDVVGRALPPGNEPAIARAIERLSAAFRAGAETLGYEDPTTRAAYLWHHVPAHVCDLTALWLDLADRWIEPESLTVLSLGAGPGSEVLALGEAITRRHERGQEVAAKRVEAIRVDRVREWDDSFTPLLGAARAAWAERDPGDPWTLAAAPAVLPWDVCQGPPTGPVRAAAARADLLVLSNLLTELPPRGEPGLPPAAREALTTLFADARAGSTWLIVDRAGAPGAQARIEAIAGLARVAAMATRGGQRLEVRGPKTREVRCACALTRRAKALYELVQLPTTKVEDRPVRNCHTAWCALCW